MMIINEFDNFKELSAALAQQWFDLVQKALRPCQFALAGGTTPAPLYRQFDQLLRASEKECVQLIATDERWVDDTDQASNEGLFRQCFRGSSDKWRLVSLKNDQPTPSAALADINQRIAMELPNPFDAVILGMGNDGHIASLFPNAPHLLVNDPTVNCVSAVHPQNSQARMSLSFARLLNTRAIWLVITGAEKRAVLEQAKPQSPVGVYLAAALSGKTCKLEVFWCP